MEIAITQVGPKHRIVIPAKIRKAAGVVIGDLLEAKARGREIILRPKALVDKAVVEARLREAEGDIKAGRVTGPFKTHGELLRHLRQRRRK